MAAAADRPRGAFADGGALLRRLGVRWRLLLAFFGISAFAVIAAAAALYAFAEVGKLLGRITEERLEHFRREALGRGLAAFTLGVATVGETRTSPSPRLLSEIPARTSAIAINTHRVMITNLVCSVEGRLNGSVGRKGTAESFSSTG